MKQITNNKKQQGYTIVEILIGVIVSAIVIAGIYAGWNTFYSSNQANTIETEVKVELTVPTVPVILNPALEDVL